MTSTVKRSVPPPALVIMGNPVVRMLLGSPLHELFDDSFLVLPPTGRLYDIPVGYVDMEGKLAAVRVARWRVNLRGGADVEVTLRGRRRPMHALLEEDPAAVAVSYQAMMTVLAGRRHSASLASRCPAGARRRCWNSATRPANTGGRSSLSPCGEVAVPLARSRGTIDWLAPGLVLKVCCHPLGCGMLRRRLSGLNRLVKAA